MTGQDSFQYNAATIIIPGISYGVSKTALAPIERIKLLLQCQPELLKQNQLKNNYTGIINCLKQIKQTEGLISLWRGNSLNIIKYFPAQLFNFYCKDKILAMAYSNFYQEKDSYSKKVLLNLFSGGLTGSLSLLITYPLDFARVRMATDVATYRFSGINNLYRQIHSSDNLRGPYRGFGVALFSIFFYKALYFGLYDSYRMVASQSETPNYLVNFLMGYLVTMTAGTMTYPLDTINKRMMMTSGTGNHYKSSFDCARQIFNHEGFRSFYRGFSCNILMAGSGAFLLIGYDFVKNIQ